MLEVKGDFGIFVGLGFLFGVGLGCIFRVG